MITAKCDGCGKEIGPLVLDIIEVGRRVDETDSGVRWTMPFNRTWHIRENLGQPQLIACCIACRNLVDKKNPGAKTPYRKPEQN